MGRVTPLAMPVLAMLLRVEGSRKADPGCCGANSVNPPRSPQSSGGFCKRVGGMVILFSKTRTS